MWIKYTGVLALEDEIVKSSYTVIRYIEGICIAVFVFGFLWNGTEILQLSFPEFMMLYGGTGAVVSEAVARLFLKMIKKKESKKVKG